MVFEYLGKGRRGVVLAVAALLLGGATAVSAFGFNMGDRFGEGFSEGMDFDKGSDLDMGGSKMNWESPENVWDTGTSGGKGFSWGGGPNSGSGWGFRGTPPPAYWGYPSPYSMPYSDPRQYMAPSQPMPMPFGRAPAPVPAQPSVYTRPPAPPAPAAGVADKRR